MNFVLSDMRWSYLIYIKEVLDVVVSTYSELCFDKPFHISGNFDLSCQCFYFTLVHPAHPTPLNVDYRV